MIEPISNITWGSLAYPLIAIGVLMTVGCGYVFSTARRHTVSRGLLRIAMGMGLIAGFGLIILGRFAGKTHHETPSQTLERLAGHFSSTSISPEMVFTIALLGLCILLPIALLQRLLRYLRRNKM